MEKDEEDKEYKINLISTKINLNLFYFICRTLQKSDTLARDNTMFNDDNDTVGEQALKDIVAMSSSPVIDLDCKL